MSLAFSGIVLAAGRSTRMGRDKALLEAGGVTLWCRQRDVLAQAGAAELFLSARADQAWACGAAGFAAVLPDASPDCGPIAGLSAGLENASHPWLAVLAIDLPRMTPGWFAALRKQVKPGVGVVGRRGNFFEPLAAIYPREMAPLVREALARRDLALQRLIAEAVAAGVLEVHAIAAADETLFTNWNAPQA